jgi:hypothetical protein
MSFILYEPRGSRIVLRKPGVKFPGPISSSQEVARRIIVSLFKLWHSEDSQSTSNNSCLDEKWGITEQGGNVMKKGMASLLLP